MSTKIPATFYYDIVSPFAYLYIKQRHRLETQLDMKARERLLPSVLIPISFVYGKLRDLVYRFAFQSITLL